MNVVVIGAGNVGCAVSGDLDLKGHQTTLIKTSNFMHNENFQHLIENGGELTFLENEKFTESTITNLTRDFSAISKAEIVIITIQSNFHETLIKNISEYLTKNQIIMFIPGYLSTAYILKYCSNEDLIIVECESSPIDCRILQPGLVKVGFRNVRNPIGVFPNEKKGYVESKLSHFGYHYTYLSSVIESALHNPNLMVHTVGAILSIPRIEKTKGDYCMYWEVFTPSVWNILEKLDQEKMDVLEKLGYPRLAYIDACKYRNSLNDDMDAKSVFFEYASSPHRAKGPVVVDSRYITEDVPQGLVLLEALADQLSIKTPVCTALIEIASAALGQDFRKQGRTTERLGEETIQKIMSDRS